VLLFSLTWGYGVYVDTVGTSSVVGVTSSAMQLIVLV